MTFKTAIVAATVATVLSFGAAEAAEQTIRPLQGVSFHAGTKHAVAYFLSEAESCNLVVTWIDDARFQPARKHSALEPGQATRYRLTEGKSFEFECAGPTMTVRALEATAGH